MNVMADIKRTAIVLAIIGLTLYSVESYADNVCWVPPTEREDNSPLSPAEIAGYKVSRVDGSLLVPELIVTNCVDLPATKVVQQGFVRTVDTDGRESLPSTTFRIEALASPPKPPTGITVTPSTGNASQQQ